MKSGLLAVGVAVGLVGSAASPATSPNSIAFWTAKRGLIGETVGDCSRASCSGAVELTTDGGRTSRTVLRTAGRVAWVTVTGTKDAWAVVVNCRRDDYCLLHSGDGGSNWALVSKQALASPSFGNRQKGLAVVPTTDRERLLRTSDGGRTWRGVDEPCAFDAQSVSRTSVRRAWLLCTGQGAAGVGRKEIYTTPDGGRTWTRIAYTNPFQQRPVEIGGISVGGYGIGIAFAPGGRGLLWTLRGTLYVTGDGGRHWRGRPDVAAPERDFGVSGWMLRDGTGFVILSRSGNERLLETHDGGRTWHIVRRWR